MRGLRLTITILIVSAGVASGQTGVPPDRPNERLKGSPVIGIVTAVRSQDATIAIRRFTWPGAAALGAKEYRVANASALIGMNPGDRVQGWYSSADASLHRLRKLARGATGSLGRSQAGRSQPTAAAFQ